MTTWVLLRGLAREARHWGALPDLLRQALPPSDTVVALDLPGNGALFHEASPTCVPAIVARARELAPREPCVLVALSLGGMVALEWARSHPQEVRACVLLNTSLGRFSPFWQRLRPAAYGTLLRILLASDAALREGEVWRLTSNRPPDAEVIGQWAAHARERPVGRANVLRQLVAAARHRAPAQAPPVPTLLLASEHDRLVSVQCSRAMAAAWQLPLALHPAAGHDLALDDPEWVVDRAVTWVRRL